MAALRYEISPPMLKNIAQVSANTNEIPNHFTFKIVFAVKGAIYYVAIATVIFHLWSSHVIFTFFKILCFRAKAHLVFHRCLYNKVIVLYCMVLVNSKKGVVLRTFPLVPPLSVNIGLKALEQIAVLCMWINEVYLHVKLFIIRLFTDPFKVLVSKKIKCCLEKNYRVALASPYRRRLPLYLFLYSMHSTRATHCPLPPKIKVLCQNFAAPKWPYTWFARLEDLPWFNKRVFSLQPLVKFGRRTTSDRKNSQRDGIRREENKKKWNVLHNQEGQLNLKKAFLHLLKPSLLLFTCR